MRAAHVALAVLVAIIWGVAFVATRVGLDAFTAPQLVVLRFAIAAVPALLLPRPALAWSALIPVGLTLFAGQFLFQFFGIAGGMPPGLASVIVQTQALFTIVFAALALGERPSTAQWTGSGIALAGLALIGFSVSGDFSPAAFALTLVSPVSFGVGNVLLKRLGPADMTSLMAWLSLVPPLPALLLSLAIDGPVALPRALAAAPAASLGAALFLGLVATSLAYALWGALLRRYPAATVAPFALLVPLVGALSSALLFGERFGPRRLAGMALVLAGVAVSLGYRKRSAILGARRSAPGGQAMQAVKDASHLYEVERRARHAERPGFRITELQISPTQQVPWHSHTNVQDTFYVLEGELRLFLRDPKEEIRLKPAETYAVRPGRPHLVTNPGPRSATFLVLQGIGEYDYVPLTGKG